MSGPGVIISSIDNIPTQLPRESTDLFGTKLLPYINEFVSDDAMLACIVNNFTQLKVDPGEPLESQHEAPDVVKNVSAISLMFYYCQ